MCICVLYVHVCALCMCKSVVLVIFVNKPRHREGGISAEELPHQFDLRACLWGIALTANWCRRAQGSVGRQTCRKRQLSKPEEVSLEVAFFLGFCLKFLP